MVHLCMDGHLAHPPEPWWQYAIDLWWVTLFLLAAVSVRLSGLRHRYRMIGVLLYFVGSRLLLGVLDDILIVVTLPLLIRLGILAVRILRRDSRDLALIESAA